ncbi:hypothetical protein LCGC14_0459420 [marine sediment metagenome]|uniref:Uncharacterized protein n=1 Tax=marine sediment metagenome TaxID=412755 RepID=A0A0F9VPF7_9ZZZZ
MCRTKQIERIERKLEEMIRRLDREIASAPIKEAIVEAIFGPLFSILRR